MFSSLSASSAFFHFIGTALFALFLLTLYLFFSPQYYSYTFPCVRLSFLMLHLSPFHSITMHLFCFVYPCCYHTPHDIPLNFHSLYVPSNLSSQRQFFFLTLLDFLIIQHTCLSSLNMCLSHYILILFLFFVLIYFCYNYPMLTPQGLPLHF